MGGSGHGPLNGYRIRLSPNWFAAGEVEAIHRDLQMFLNVVKKQVVVVDFLALKWIVWRAFDWIRVGADEICDSAMFVTNGPFSAVRKQSSLVAWQLPGGILGGLNRLFVCIGHGRHILYAAKTDRS